MEIYAPPKGGAPNGQYTEVIKYRFYANIFLKNKANERNVFMKKVISILLTAALILSCFSMTALTAFAIEETTQKVITAAFSDFTDATRNSNIRLEGLSDANPGVYAQYDVRAKIEDSKIKLTPKKWNPGIGTAFLNQKITTVNGAFSTHFTFEQHSPNTDGFSFVIGDYGPTCPTKWGYGGMSQNNNTLYVAFDTYQNSEYGETSNNFIYLRSSVAGGSGWVNLGQRDLNSDEYKLADGSVLSIGDSALKHCWIEYDGTNMYLTLSNTSVRSEGVSMNFDLTGSDIKTMLDKGELYFGFTSLIFDSDQYTNICSWYLDGNYAPIDLSQNAYTDEAAVISMQALTSDNATATVSILAEDYSGQPAANVELTLTASAGEFSESTVTTDENGCAIVELTGESLSGAVVKAITGYGISTSASVVLSDSKPITAAFSDFSDDSKNSALVLEGISDSVPNPYAPYDVRAKVEDGKIKLTPKKWNPGLGTAFLDNKVSTENAAFSTYFTFEQYSHNTDGFAFVIGNSGTSCPTNFGQGGMSRDDDTVYVFFDTYKNDEYGDLSNNFIQVYSSIKNSGGWNVYANKDLNSEEYLNEEGTPKVSIGDGVLKHCWIDYDGTNMYITLSYTANRSEGIDVVFNFGRNIIEDLLGNDLYFGFTSLIFDSDQYTNICSWYLDNKYNPIDSTANYSFASMSIDVTAKATSAEEADVQVTAYDYAGNLYSGAQVTLSSANGRFEPITVTTGLNGKATATVSGDVVYMDTVNAVANGGTSASTLVSHTEPDLLTEFEAKTFNSTLIENGSLNYRIYVPDEYDGTQSYPVLLFLHGLGERGDNNTSQLATNTGILKRLTGMEGDSYKCIIVAPQCPSDDTWCNPDNNCVDTSESVVWNNYDVETTVTTNANIMAYELLQSVISEYNADSDRIYGAGVSMGCFGVMNMAMNHPRLFSAVAAVCGGTDSDAAYRLYGTSVWFFHGGSDRTVSVENSRAAYSAYSAAGLDVKYTEYSNVDHDSWTNAFAETEFLKWMFSKSLPELAKGDVNGDGRIDIRDLVRLKKRIGIAENTVIYGNADYDDSGALDSGDLTTVRRILLGS